MKHKEECECILCNSKCPKCGSTEVDIDFNLKCSYQNQIEDVITIDIKEVENVYLYCESCDYSEENNEKLTNAIILALPSGLECKWIENGRYVKTTQLK